MQAILVDLPVLSIDDVRGGGGGAWKRRPLLHLDDLRANAHFSKNFHSPPPTTVLSFASSSLLLKPQVKTRREMQPSSSSKMEKVVLRFRRQT